MTAALQQRCSLRGAPLPPPAAPPHRSAPPPPPLAAKSKKKPQRPPKPAPAAGETETLRVDLGGGKAVQLLRAAEIFDFSAARSASFERLQELYGAGDVIWPASVALARLLAHCPSFVAGRRVLELGAGLGLPGAAAAQAGAASLLLADRDSATLALAARSAALNAPQLASGGGISTLNADWTDLDAWPPPGAVDLVLASDILYDPAFPAPVAALLARLLAPGEGEAGEGAAPRRALFADAPQRLNRDAFVAACAERGLTAQVGPLPGPEGTQLIAVVRAGTEAAA